MKTNRVCLCLIAVFLCLPSLGLAQSNAKPDYKHQHKSAQKYQKSIRKEQRRRENAEARQARAYRKQHQ